MERKRKSDRERDTKGKEERKEERKGKGRIMRRRGR